MTEHSHHCLRRSNRKDNPHHGFKDGGMLPNEDVLPLCNTLATSDSREQWTRPPADGVEIQVDTETAIIQVELTIFISITKPKFLFELISRRHHAYIMVGESEENERRIRNCIYSFIHKPLLSHFIGPGPTATYPYY